MKHIWDTLQKFRYIRFGRVGSDNIGDSRIQIAVFFALWRRSVSGLDLLKLCPAPGHVLFQQVQKGKHVWMRRVTEMVEAIVPSLHLVIRTPDRGQNILVLRPLGDGESWLPPSSVRVQTSNERAFKMGHIVLEVGVKVKTDLELLECFDDLLFRDESKCAE